MSSSEKQRQFYIKETKQWVPVSEEFSKAYYRHIKAYISKQQYSGRCGCPRRKWWLCNEICNGCEFCKAVAPLSLEAEMETDEGTTTLAEILPDPTANIEEAIIKGDLLDALYRELGHAGPRGRHICQLINEDKSRREIARIMNLPRASAQRYIKRLVEDLRCKLEDYR